MPRTSVCKHLRFLLCITRHFYVRAVIIIVGSLLAFTTWGEISWTTPTTCYCIVLLYCLLVTFARKGCLDGKRLHARRTDTQESLQLLQGEQISAQQPRRPGEQRFSWQLPAAASPEPIVEIHRPYEPSESPSSGEREPPNEPLQPAEHSDSGRNVPQSSAGPSTKSTRNTPMDLTNKEAQIYVPSQQTESSDSGNNVPQLSPDPCTHSTPLDVSNEKPLSDGPLQAEPSDLGSNVPQSSTDPSIQSTRSASLDVANEGPRSDESLQQSGPSDLGSNVPQSSTDPESPGSASLDDITNEETRND